MCDDDTRRSHLHAGIRLFAQSLDHAWILFLPTILQRNGVLPSGY